MQLADNRALTVLRKPIVRLIYTRVALAGLTLFGVSAVVFFGSNLLPGNPARAALGDHASPEAVLELERQFHLNTPVGERYVSWLNDMVHGNLGNSIPSADPVVALIGDRVRNTVALTLGALVLLIALGLILGVASACRRDHVFDHAVNTTSLALGAFPEFVSGTLLIIVFAVYLKVVPPVSLIQSDESIFSQASLLVLPVLTLLSVTLGQVVRIVRAVTIEILDSEYVAMARLKGASSSRILVHHVLPNMTGAVVQTLALNAAWLAAGVVVTESVFQLPGLGSELASAVGTRDIPMVEAITMLITCGYLLINLLADVTVMLLNPQIRRAR